MFYLINLSHVSPKYLTTHPVQNSTNLFLTYVVRSSLAALTCVRLSVSQFLFLVSLYMARPPSYGTYVFPAWSLAVGWLMVCASIICVPAYAIYKFLITPGTVQEV